MPKIKGLGEGIADLLELDSTVVSTTSTDPDDAEGYRQIPLNQLTPGRYQPRKDFNPEELAELCQSVKSNGIIQPILVTPFNDGFEIVAGERRWRAATQAGLQTIPAVVKHYSDNAIAAITLVENLQRKDLNIVEEAEGLTRLKMEFELTHEEIAEQTGRSRPYVTNMLRLLNLDGSVLSLLREGELDMGHGRALLGASLADQFRLAQHVIEKKLTVRATEQLIKTERNSGESPKPQPSKSVVVHADQAKILADKLRADISIREIDGLIYDIRIKCVGSHELAAILKLLDSDLSIQ